MRSHLVTFSGTPTTFELQMAEGSGTACVTAVSVGTVSPVE
ncbi:hypothetical protein [Nocardioides pyridinolyticus]